jgi:hypothetical protein
VSEFLDKINELLVGAFGTEEQKREVVATARDLDAIPGPMGKVVRSHYVAWVTGYRYLVHVPEPESSLPQTVILSDPELARREHLTTKAAIIATQEACADAMQKRIDRCAQHLRAGWGKEALCFVCSQDEWRKAKELEAQDSGWRAA